MRARDYALFALVLGAVLAVVIALVSTAKKSQTAFEQFGGLAISSPAFVNGGEIPDEYGCLGENVNPPLVVRGVPENAQSLALVVDDPDAPLGTFTHWVVWNIKPEAQTIQEGSAPSGAVEGKNDFGSRGYGGPCPPFGTHRYFFKLYALDERLNLSGSAGKSELERAMQGHVLAQAVLVGKYSKK